MNNNIYNYDYKPMVNSYNSPQIQEKHFSNKKIVIIILSFILLVLSFIIIKNLIKSYEVKIILNGSDIVEKESIKCKSNIKGECFLTLPSAKRYNGEVLGYSTNSNSKDAEYQIGQEIEVTQDLNLYVISKKENKLTIDETNINEVRDNNITCEVYNGETSCEVNVPMFNKLGYKIDGYYKNNRNEMINFNSKLLIDNDIILHPSYEEYPLYNSPGSTRFNIERSVYLYNTYLDIGYGCNKNTTEQLIKQLNNLYKKYPFYAYNSKLTIVNDTEYNSFINLANIGASSGFTDENLIDNPTVVFRCDDLYTYTVAIHELSHTLDVRYKSIHGHYMNEEQELIELRNKYKNINNRPLRNYAYSDKGNSSVPEFFAELLTYYYINYVDTTTQLDNNYIRGNFPDDMKKMAEKYICIGRNNFDKSKCN